MNNFITKHWSRIVLYGGLMMLGLAYLYLHLGSDDTRLTRIWITNNSGERAKITIEYSAHEVCPDNCILELGNFAVNEGRGTSFATPGEGSFAVVAEFTDGRKVVGDGGYTEGWKFGVLVNKDSMDIKSPLGETKGVNSAPLRERAGKIDEYILANVVKANFGGKVFCSYEQYQPDDPHANPDMAYIQALCEEYYLEGSELKMGSGASVPLAIKFQNNEIVEVKGTGDGTEYAKGIKANFPENIQKDIFRQQDFIEGLINNNRIKAENYFKK